MLFTRIFGRFALLLIAPLALVIVVTRLVAPLMPQDGQIAFSGALGDVETLYLLDLTHQQVHPLARDAFAARLPGWSPDGARLAFADSGGRIFWDTVFVKDMAALPEMALPDDPDGGGQVTEPPVWSPDADSIVVSYAPGREIGQGDVRLVHYGSKNANISTLPLPSTRANNHALRWLPDGRLLYVLVENDRVRLDEIDLANLSIHTLQEWDFDVTSTWQPVIAPDGEKFVISATRPNALTSDLYVFERGVPDVIDITQLNTSNETQPVWSSDSTRIAYKLLNGSSQYVVVTAADGSHARMLFEHDSMRISDLNWSPDDTRVSFVLSPIGERYLCIVTVADGALDCPYAGGGVSEPVWRP